MPQGIVSDVLWAGIDAGIKHGELWLQVHNNMQGIDYASVQSEPLSLLHLNDMRDDFSIITDI